MSITTTHFATACTALFICFTTLGFANSTSTQIIHLDNINKEWINQNDLDPSIYSNPSQSLNEIELIQKHLSLVETTLRKRSTDHLSIK